MLRSGRAALSASAAAAAAVRMPASMPPMAPATLELHQRVVAGDRYGLAKAITLVESTNPQHRVQARHLLALSLEALRSSQTKLTIRIGLSGPPGVGKSTFIEALGMHLVGLNKKVAVLAVDPSSTLSGGSILGDKTRMTELTRQQLAYVRPSPSRGTLGGVARNTNEGIVLCESAGYEVILIETVGVGQSETMVADMVDLYTLLVPPAGGDELQGIKRGIMELADLVIVNKADGDLIPAARRAKLEYTSALKLMRPKTEHWRPRVLSISAVTHDGIAAAWEAMSDFYESAVQSGALERLRGEQRKRSMWRQVVDEIMEQLHRDEAVKARVGELNKAVASGQMTPDVAAAIIVDCFERASRQ